MCTALLDLAKRRGEIAGTTEFDDQFAANVSDHCRFPSGFRDNLNAVKGKTRFGTADAFGESCVLRFTREAG
jgi:hypothetical protein